MQVIQAAVVVVAGPEATQAAAVVAAAGPAATQVAAVVAAAAGPAAAAVDTQVVAVAGHGKHAHISLTPPSTNLYIKTE